MAGHERKPRALQDLQETLNLKAARIKLQQRKQAQSSDEAKQTQQEELARNHHRRNLLSRTFDGWRRASWSNEWTLSVRANYHYKYHLYLRVWKAWEVYVIRQRVMRAKVSVAVMQANLTALKKYFGSWKQYIRERQQKKSRETAAVTQAQRALVERCFTTWKERLKLIRQDGRAGLIADQHRTTTLMQKFLVRWRQYVTYRGDKMMKMREADSFYSKTILKKCIHQGFLAYTAHRREKLQTRATASQAHSGCLTYKSFHHWHRQMVLRRRSAEKREQVQALGQSSKMRRVLNHWKYYVKLCYDERQNMRIAVLHYQGTLMRMAFGTLHLRLVNRRLKALQQEEADSFHKNMISRHAWHQWMRQIDHLEELRILPDTEKAQKNYRSVILRKTFAGWREYHGWRQSRQNHYRLAEAHYACSLGRRTLTALGENVSWQNIKREDAELAQQFFREHALTTAFHAWRDRYHLSLDLRMMERMAILHNHKKSMRRAFSMWRSRTEDVLTQQENMVVASQHWHSRFCLRYLLQWKQFIEESKESNSQERLAERHHCRRVTRKVFTDWKMYTTHRRRKAVVLERAEKHYARRLLGVTMDQWKLFHVSWRQRLDTVEGRYNRHKADDLRTAFQTWKVNASASAEERRQEELAQAHWRMAVSSRVMTAWHSYTLHHAVKAARKAEQIRAAVQHLNKGKLRGCFGSWKKLQLESTTERAKTCLARAHYSKKVLEGALVRWKDFRKLQIRKMLLERQCAWLSSTRLQAKYFLCWRRQYARSISEQSKTSIALWHWSLVLQGRVILAWHSYMLERRGKKRRYEEAMDRRHQRLLETGLCNWLKTSDALAESRAKSIADNQRKVAAKTFHLVRRYALLWRQKALANQVRKSEQQHPIWRQPEPSLEGLSPRIPHSSTRRRPKRPNFLRDSLRSAGLWDSVDGTGATERPADPSTTITRQRPPVQIPDKDGHSENNPESLDCNDDVGPSVGTDPSVEASRMATVSAPAKGTTANQQKKKQLLPPSAFMAPPSETHHSPVLLRPQALKENGKTLQKREMHHDDRVELRGSEECVDHEAGVDNNDSRNHIGKPQRMAAESLNGRGDSSMLRTYGHLVKPGRMSRLRPPDDSNYPTHRSNTTYWVDDGATVQADSSGKRQSSPPRNREKRTHNDREDIIQCRGPTDITRHGADVTAGMFPSFHNGRKRDPAGDNDPNTSSGSVNDGTSSSGRREREPDVLSKVLQLKTLLLQYQQQKQQTAILVDQKKVLTLTLEEDDDDGSLQEEYELVTEDIRKLTETSQSLKLRITTLMEETGLRN